MIDFRTFEAQGLGVPATSEYLTEPQGALRRSAAVKVWDKIGVGNSKIAGKGVFCVEPIKSDECFEVASILLLPYSEVQKTTMMDYVFKVEESLYAIAFGNVSLYNHRNQPTARWSIDVDTQTITLKANRDILPGEEIFISYGKKYWQTREISAKKSPSIQTLKK